MKNKLEKLKQKTLKVVEIFPQGFKVKYKFAYLKAWLDKKQLSFKKFSSSDNQDEYDLAFVNLEKEWILDGICQEINKYCDKITYFHYSLYNIPKAKAYFFAHYSLFKEAILKNPQILGQVNLVFYTHSRNIGVMEQELVYFLKKGTYILTMNTACEKMLIEKGVDSAKIKTVLGGADEEKFSKVEKIRGKKPCIGFSVRYSDQSLYDRKNYELVIELIKKLDFSDIILLGTDWEKHKEFINVQSLSYFQYVNVFYDEYPKYYQKMDIFVSVSKLEGGPIPLIESMMCNVVPVVSNTGFAPDIIVNGKNGFIFDVNSTADDIIKIIKQALEIETDVRATIQHLTWRNFSKEVQQLAGLL